MKNLLILQIFFLFPWNTWSNLVEEGYFIPGATINKVFLRPELTIDHPNSLGFELYGPKGLGLWLNKLNLSYSVLDEFNPKQRIRINEIFDQYPTQEEMRDKLMILEKKYPQILKLFSIGQSEQGQDLWVMKISDNVEQNEVEPEVKFIANMHGDEVVGRELLVGLIEYLAENYTKDLEIKSLVDNMEIFIMPSMNPDGFSLKRRGNGKYVDLNRDFPDFSTNDNQNIPNGRAIETKAIMNFQKGRQFALSANFHGGAVVVNYPWDSINQAHPLKDLMVYLSHQYADHNSLMVNSQDFPGGITNGYSWYEVKGGMQDWSYFYHGDLQVTVELSSEKLPPYSRIPYYFSLNKESMINYLQAVYQGAGFVLPEKINGEVAIQRVGGGTLGIFLFKDGEFYKVLNKGRYLFKVKTSVGNWQFETSVSGIKGNYNILTFE